MIRPPRTFVRLATAGLLATCVVGVPLVSGGQAARTEHLLVELLPRQECAAPEMLGAAGATLVSRELRLYRIERTAASRVLPRLEDCSAVRFVSPDRAVGTMSTTDFTDPLVTSEWWRAAVGVADLTPPGPGKSVTVVDSGVSLSHPEFVGWSGLATLNAQQPEPLGGVHGTAVTSVIGAPANGVGIVGIYPLASVNSWDAALGEGTRLTTSEIVAGILAAAARGPGVINLSLGGSEPDVSIQQAIATAVRKGMLVVAAAGNDGESGSALSYPASFAHVLTVGATDQQNQATSFSSRSRFVDLAAPGQGIVVATALDKSWAAEDGTSFAAPLVSGAAAWVWTARPDLDASQVFEVMRRSATDIGPAGRDDASGWGLLSVPTALAFPAPVKDPMEPNDNIDYVKPGAIYDTGIPALTSRTKPSGTVLARVSSSEDPRDVYRISIPAKGRLTITTDSATAVDLTLWGPTTTSVTGQGASGTRLARGITKGPRENLSYANKGAARSAYLEVRLATAVRDATYRVTVAAR